MALFQIRNACSPYEHKREIIFVVGEAEELATKVRPIVIEIHWFRAMTPGVRFPSTLKPCKWLKTGRNATLRIDPSFSSQAHVLPLKYWSAPSIV